MNDRELNAHAFVAWLYLRECAKLCAKEATVDAAFVQLTYEMWLSYPDEFELLMGDGE
jgi:hypothetical protein